MKSDTFHSAPRNEAAWMGQATGWSCSVMKTGDDEPPLSPEGSGDGGPSGFNCTVMKTVADEGAAAPPVNEAAWQGQATGWSCAIM
jgi:hypothetical protein